MKVTKWLKPSGKRATIWWQRECAGRNVSECRASVETTRIPRTGKVTGMAQHLEPYRCRQCGATSYGRLTHRDARGVMAYSGIYRCSGCPMTFDSLAEWRRAEGVEAPRKGPSEAGDTTGVQRSPWSLSESKFKVA